MPLHDHAQSEGSKRLSEPVSALLLAGPPASGALWRAVIERWGARIQAQAIELFDPPPADPTVSGLAEAVAARLRALPGRRVLVAHGSAVPVALLAASRVAPEALVLSNGPVHALDPALQAVASLCAAPALAANTVLHPTFLRRWLASSVGLRRAVVNPYVMDRDTVVALLRPLVQSSAHRLALARFLRDLPQAVKNPLRFDGPSLLIWGDADPLYPASHADEARIYLPNADVHPLAGAQHLHPEERPWAFADAVELWLANKTTMT